MEKMDMAQAIIDTFPVLRDNSNSGYVCFLVVH